MADLTIRAYDPGDEERVAAVMDAALRDAGANFEDAPDDGGMDDAFLADRAELLVGVVDGRIVATGAYRPLSGLIREFVGGIDERTAEIKRMHVDPDHQRRGYASAILAELERRATADGYTDLVLQTTSLQTSALAFYEAAGFEEVARHRITETDEPFDLVCYRKQIE